MTIFLFELQFLLKLERKLRSDLSYACYQERSATFQGLLLIRFLNAFVHRGWTDRFQCVDISNGDPDTYLVSTLGLELLSRDRLALTKLTRYQCINQNANILIYNKNSLLQMVQNAYVNLLSPVSLEVTLQGKLN